VRKSRESLGFVSSNTCGIGGSDTGNKERLVNVHTATNRINDFKSQQETSYVKIVETDID